MEVKNNSNVLSVLNLFFLLADNYNVHHKCHILQMYDMFSCKVLWLKCLHQSNVSNPVTNPFIIYFITKMLSSVTNKNST